MTITTAQTALDLAAILNGREYGKEITREEAKQAKADGLVVVYGYSDDNMEFEGAIRDEVGCYGGGSAYLDAKGLIANECENDECPYFNLRLEGAASIEAVCDQEGYSWIYKTAIPHATFEVMEDGEKFCRGIVFALADVGSVHG